HGGARPAPYAAATTSFHLAPEPMVATPVAGSMVTSRISAVASSNPSSQAALAPWPVACTRTRMPLSAAYRTAAATSSGEVAATTASGWWWIRAFQGAQAAAYSGSWLPRSNLSILRGFAVIARWSQGRRWWRAGTSPGAWGYL